MNLYIGCPIWSWKGWVGNFYPEGTKPPDFLHEYTRRLTTVEGNTTFYAVPAQKTLEGWAEEMPSTASLGTEPFAPRGVTTQIAGSLRLERRGARSAPAMLYSPAT